MSWSLVLVLVQNDSDCWLGCCVAWEENRVDVILDVISVIVVSVSWTVTIDVGPPQVTQLCSTAFTGAGAGTGDVCLSRSRALTISFNSATSGDTPEVEALVLTLATMALLRE
ncbi:hypothetical protein Tco_0672404 [Tanacetum coccineum]